jgi:hypothetical protein
MSEQPIESSTDRADSSSRHPSVLSVLASSPRTTHGPTFLEGGIADALSSVRQELPSLNETVLRSEIAGRVEELASAVSEELLATAAAQTRAAASETAAKSTSQRVSLSFGLANAAVAMWLVLEILNFFGHHFGLLDTYFRGSFWVRILIAVGATIVLGAPAILLPQNSAMRDMTAAIEELMTEETRLAGRLRREIAGLIRQRINEHVEQSSDQPVRLNIRQAPALVELELADPVSSIAYQQLLDFLTEHVTSAIGLAGPRGVGKSTLLRKLCYSVEFPHVGVYLQAPVKYDAADFVRVIHSETVSAILKSLGINDSNDSRSKLRSAQLVRSLVAVVLLAIGLGAIAVNFMSTPLWIARLNIVGALGIGATVVAVYLIIPVGRDPSPKLPAGASSNERHIARFLTKEQAKLKWSSSSKVGGKLTVSGWKPASMERSWESTKTERDRSHPERVAEFRAFCRTYHEMPGSVPMLITIDELDKISDFSEAIEVINGVKDLLHLEQTHFAISVSEEALHSFALRGVPVRDAFDSSLDAVVRLRRLDVVEAMNILNRRVVNLPVPIALYCFAAAGGLPRDLIREARSCVALARVHGDGLVMADIVAKVILEDLETALIAALGRARAVAEQPLVDELAELTLQITPSSSTEPAVLLATATATLAKVKDLEKIVNSTSLDGPMLFDSLHAYTVLAENMASYFCSPKNEGEWQTEMSSGRAYIVATCFARARANLAVSPDLARSLAISLTGLADGHTGGGSDESDLSTALAVIRDPSPPES